MRKVFKTIVTLVLVFFPIWGGLLISKFTPYNEDNSITNYIIAYSAITIVASLLLFYIISRYKNAFMQPILPGVFLFFIGIIMLGIVGFAAPPDLSTEILEHPEREHLRYVLLYFGLFLFGLFFINLFVRDLLSLKRYSKWIMIVLFVVSITELLWEFYHHYYYPEAFKLWIEKGNKVEDFGKSYDNNIVGAIGSFGRLAIYIITLWLSIRLYKLKRIDLWSPIVTSIFCVLGIISSIFMFLYFNFGIETPKELGLLIIFFIPGIPFFILYWIGAALLTRKVLSH